MLNDNSTDITAFLIDVRDGSMLEQQKSGHIKFRLRRP